MSRTLAQVRNLISPGLNAQTLEMNIAINNAILSVQGEMFYSIAPYEVAMTTNDFEYDISASGLARITAILEEDTAGVPTSPINEAAWSTVGANVLKINETYYSPTTGGSLWLYGQATQGIVSSDSNAIYTDVDYIVKKAKAELIANRAMPTAPNGGVNQAAEMWLRLAAFWEQQAEKARLTSVYRAAPGSRRVAGGLVNG